jgi:NAD(P)-dependent dehydrogenase (short-subunit alcohol dehydrogenase family)
VAVVTGGTGVLGSAIARGLAGAGARVGVLGRREERAFAIANEIAGSGGEAIALPADVLRRKQLEAAWRRVQERWGRIDILVNAAGGNRPGAVVGEGESIFDLPLEAWQQVLDLNLTGTLLACQVFGAPLAQRREGSIVNVSSMAAQRPLTRVVAYSAAKAALDNLTRWLAVELARRHGSGLRVNAIAPGFFIGEQNHDLLQNPDGTLTSRGRAIIEHTPAGRFGEPEEVVGAVVWLCGPGARFVNGAVIPIDGGFNAFSGV